MISAHIAGIPVEETLLSFAPVFFAGGGLAGLSRWLRRKEDEDQDQDDERL